MSIKTKLLKSSLFKGIIKLGIKLTPKIFVSGVANVVLKGIAKFSKISFDLNKRTAYVKVTLYGEEEPIEITINGFEISGDAGKDNYQFILHNAESNKPWMTNIFARIAGKSWAIPPIPQYKDEVDFVASLLKVDNPKQIAKNPKKAEKRPAKAVKGAKKTSKNPRKVIKSSKKVTKDPKKTISNTKKATKNHKKTIRQPEKPVTNVNQGAGNGSLA